MSKFYAGRLFITFTNRTVATDSKFVPHLMSRPSTPHVVNDWALITAVSHAYCAGALYLAGVTNR